MKDLQSSLAELIRASSARIPAVADTPTSRPKQGPVVKLNVGGQVFETTWRTFRRFPSPFVNRVMKSVSEHCEKIRLFIDRDPKHFRIILNYVRDGMAVLPRDDCDLRELLLEARYYQLTDLEDELMALPACKTMFAANTEGQVLQTRIARAIDSDRSMQRVIDTLLTDVAFAEPLSVDQISRTDVTFECTRDFAEIKAPSRVIFASKQDDAEEHQQWCEFTEDIAEHADAISHALLAKGIKMAIKQDDSYQHGLKFVMQLTFA